MSETPPKEALSWEEALDATAKNYEYASWDALRFSHSMTYDGLRGYTREAALLFRSSLEEKVKELEIDLGLSQIHSESESSLRTQAEKALEKAWEENTLLCERLKSVKEETVGEGEKWLKRQCIGIINQLFDLAEVPVSKRQAINDKADQYIIDRFKELFEEYKNKGK